MNEQTIDLVSRVWEDSRVRLKNFIARKVSNQADVEDVLQNVFYKIHQSAHQLEEEEKLYPWIYQLTRNAIIDYYRQSKKHLADPEDALEAAFVDWSEPDVEEEILNWIAPMLEDLPAKDREALLLTDIQGLTQKEFAEKLDISLSGAKSRVQRARGRLKDVLLECCHLEFNRAGRIVEYKPRTDRCRTCSN